MADNTHILNTLERIFGGGSSVFSQRGSDDYEKNNNSYFSAFENEIKPSFIVRPESAEQIQDLVRAFRHDVLDGSCRLAVRGGGHTPFAGSANIQDGITIDTRSLKGVILSEDKSTVEIAVGEVWTTVYTELEKHRLTTTGGRVGRVGVAGFILGGGLSMFSNRRGFACDAVTEFKIVLASGELVCASADENADLWVALKGGLNNFGIVTSITMKTHPSTEVWGGLTYYPSTSFTEILTNTIDLVHNEEDQDVHIMASAGFGFGHQVVSVVMYHTQGKVNPPALQRFTGVQPQIEQMCSLRSSTNSDFCEELSKFSSDGARQYWASITIKPDIDLISAFHEKWEQTLGKIKDAEGFIFSFGFHPLTKSLLEASQKAGGNAMDISPEDGPLFVLLINPIWALPQDDSRIFAAVENLVAELRQLATERGALHRYIFTNYAYQSDDVMAGYGKESLERLKAVSAKYDPEGVFQKGVPGGFKLL
ncbi:bifunctional solanapyrone synthase [Triangularia verruculosa]|uniref:Bifunctional solanapyrone synthase n=1 Tax=Triangularia verruculosa TaxID=2587418 RepID=A0AAN6XBR2_9PEZI|nr:bifunctional solanapyrone synthase [Triangularia verruculosa]